MGKSTSCFKLITCGGDAAEKDDYQVSEINDSNDKCGWSFRKKSARNRVLSNTVIAKVPSSANKETSECTSFNFQPLPEPNVVEKIYTTNCSDAKPQLSSFESSQISEIHVIETESKVDVSPPESTVIIIQAAIRGLLAQRELLLLQNVVKLQSAVRGHLVRRQAIGTLRCVQAIMKMQVLLRARRAQQLRPENHLNSKDGKNDSSEALGNENHMIKSNLRHTSIEKLLSNSFARQLLESTPKNKLIHFKCDPSKADSAWKWLERWMSVSSKDIAEDKKTSSLAEQSDESKDRTSVFQFETGIPSEVFLESTNSKPTVGDSPLLSEDEEKVPPEKTIAYDAKVASAETDSFQNDKAASDASAPPELNSSHQKPEIDGEQRKRSLKRFASDQLEAEGKKSVNGSRKVSNPAFIAAQSKFEELSSMENSGRTSSLSHQDAAVESHGDTSSVGTGTAYRSKEFSCENPAPNLSKVGGSECGTELSISSTLDSPDISEVGAMENERYAKDLVEGNGNLENTIIHNGEANVPCAIPASNLSTSVLDQSEIVDEISGNMIHSVVAVDSEEPVIETEKNASDQHREQAEAVLQDLRSSPEASPRSHITIPESQGTPSSQVSTKPKDSKMNKTGSRNKRGALSVGSKSPANTNHDSGSRGSREQLPKGQRSGKRRNSFGSVKPDHIDQEPRDDSSNNNSLPRFMQATESAKAKINANNSPKSIPDVHERDIQVKKRHSLPGATGRQVSPRIQHSISQAQQNAKGNSVHSPQERKWVR
ncbi:protein IQ-DOMAIN 32-like isoform X2 [Gastrolobium bilobum]|uniref:protein IQ-DOMAIN 32-like isoform X2 n=1 Tax=Gastrolobium bilobum TaxID=150636 RepID=UPI002AB044CE|nr:protein IQ-DOMAIN 32-like isoform X2 [Gastrolobium bilobum]